MVLRAVGLVLGFFIHRALGLTLDDAAHRLWFPHGYQSLYFALIGFLNDNVEDCCAHYFVHYTEARRPKPCHFARVFPGWLSNGATGLKRAMLSAGVILWVPAWVTQFAFVFEQKGVL